MEINVSIFAKYSKRLSMNFYMSALKKYFVFRGRARRSEFWSFFGINFFILFILFAIRFILNKPDLSLILDIVSLVILVAVLVPGTAVCVRRLHDTSRSGWCLLLILIPVIGIIILLFFFLEDSSPAYNSYGEYPKFVYIH